MRVLPALGLQLWPTLQTKHPSMPLGRDSDREEGEAVQLVQEWYGLPSTWGGGQTKKSSGKNNKKQQQKTEITKQRIGGNEIKMKIKWKQFREIINIKIIKLNYKIIFLIKNI